LFSELNPGTATRQISHQIKIWLRPFRTLGAFSLLWLATLSLGIAISAVAYTYFKHTVLAPLDLPKSDQLYAIVRSIDQSAAASAASSRAKLTVAKLDTLTRGLLSEVNAIKGLEAAGSVRQLHRLSGPGLAARQVALLQMTSNWLRVLGVKAQFGRRLDRSDCDSDRVMISDALWRDAFKADASVLGRVVEIAGESKTIVGVLPQSLQRVVRADVFSTSKFHAVARDREHSLKVIARRFNSLSADALSVRLSKAFAAWRTRVADAHSKKDTGLSPIDLHTDRNNSTRETLAPILALVALLALLMACNASSLFAVSVLERVHELAIEVALGARVRRLLLQIAAQSLVFTAFATAIAVPLCPLLFALARRYFLDGSAELADVQYDLNALLVAAAAFALLNLAAALLPAAAILRRINLVRSERALLSTTGARFARSALAFQLVAATAVILLSLLLLRTLQNLNQIDPGFDLEHLWSAQIVLPNRTDTGKPEKDQSAVLANVEFMEFVRRDVAKIPGVRAASFASEVPLALERSKAIELQIAGAKPDASGRAPYAQLRAIDAHYLSALGLKTVAGRLPKADSGLTDPDENVEQEVAVNQSYVARFMPGVDPIGRKIVGHYARVVGVLPAFKQLALSELSEPELYTPMALQALNESSLLVRTEKPTPPQSLEDRIRQIVRAADQNVPLAGALTGARLRDASIQDRINLSRVLTLFAALALLSTALGLFSLSAYSVAKRVREFGLRLAVGAAPMRLLREVLFENLRFTGACAAAGLVLGALLSELVANKLYAVYWFDWRSAVGAALLIQLVCVLAAMLPAWRASRTDPMTVLRD
jgi:putative ABC transport system permease protein